VLEIVEQLVVEVVAAFEGGVEVVEEDDVEGAGFGVGRKVAVGVSREWGVGGVMRGNGGWEVLVEGGDSLLVAIFKNVEALAFEGVDGLALVGDDDVNEGEVGGDVEDGFVGVGCRGGSLCGAGGNAYREHSDEEHHTATARCKRL